MNPIDTTSLLHATLDHRLNDLAAHTGLSARRLAELTMDLIDDHDVIAAHPVECRRLQARRDLARTTRSRRWQARTPHQG